MFDFHSYLIYFDTISYFKTSWLFHFFKNHQKLDKETIRRKPGRIRHWTGTVSSGWSHGWSPTRPKGPGLGLSHIVTCCTGKTDKNSPKKFHDFHDFQKGIPGISKSADDSTSGDWAVIFVSRRHFCRFAATMFEDTKFMPWMKAHHDMPSISPCIGLALSSPIVELTLPIIRKVKDPPTINASHINLWVYLRTNVCCASHSTFQNHWKAAAHHNVTYEFGKQKTKKEIDIKIWCKVNPKVAEWLEPLQLRSEACCGSCSAWRPSASSGASGRPMAPPMATSRRPSRCDASGGSWFPIWRNSVWCGSMVMEVAMVAMAVRRVKSWFRIWDGTYRPWPKDELRLSELLFLCRKMLSNGCLHQLLHWTLG